MKLTRKLLKHKQKVSNKNKRFTLNKIRGGFFGKKKKEPVPPTYIRMYVPWLFHWMSYTLPLQLLENYDEQNRSNTVRKLFENLNGLEPSCLAQIRRSLIFHFNEKKNTTLLSDLILNEIKDIKRDEYLREGKLVLEEKLTRIVQHYCDLIIKIMGDSAYKLGIKDLGMLKRRSTFGLYGMMTANVNGTRKTLKNTSKQKSFFFPETREKKTRKSFNKTVKKMKQKESNYDKPFKEFLILLSSEDKQLEDRDHFSYDIIPPEMADLVKTSIELLLEDSRVGEGDINIILDKLLDNITPSMSIVNPIQVRRTVPRRTLNIIQEEVDTQKGIEEVKSSPKRTLLLEEVQSSAEGDISSDEDQFSTQRPMTLENFKSPPKGTIMKSGVFQLKQPNEILVGGSNNTPLTSKRKIRPTMIPFKEEKKYSFCMNVAKKNYKVTIQITTSETNETSINVLDIELLKKIKYNKTDIRIVKKSLIESKN